LNTRKGEIALKWKFWEMRLSCETASTLSYKSLSLSLSLFFILELYVISRSAVNVSWPGNDLLISIRTECECTL
jgi:hypothetical protein